MITEEEPSGRGIVESAATAWSGVRDAGANSMLVLGTVVDTVLPSLG